MDDRPCDPVPGGRRYPSKHAATVYKCASCNYPHEACAEAVRVMKGER